jgi:hypothetical protein
VWGKKFLGEEEYGNFNQYIELQKRFYTEVEKCEAYKLVKGDKKLLQPEDFCEYHQAWYRDMEGCVT